MKVTNAPPTANGNITNSPAPAWNTPTTFSMAASDPDNDNNIDPNPGPLVFRWRVVQKPPLSNTQLVGADTPTPTLPFASDKDIGTWQVALDLDDDEGERRTFTGNPIVVPNIPPKFGITGANQLKVTETVNLKVDNTADADGGDFGNNVAWEVASKPQTSTSAPQSLSGPALVMPTKKGDAGVWVFRARAKDNEGEEFVSEPFTVEVINLPPKINLEGKATVKAGEPIDVKTTILDDEDGGKLTFRWSIAQAPKSAPLGVKELFKEGGEEVAAINVATTPAFAGSWVFKLEATDDDGAPNSEASAEFAVLVDAPPEAKVDGPEVLGSGSFPLVIDGSESVDPDSPCPDLPDKCHNVLPGHALNVPPDALRFSWRLLAVPPEYAEDFIATRVDEAFGKAADEPKLTFKAGELKPGSWSFELTVRDGENNEDTATYDVLVVEEGGPPTVLLTPPTRHLTSADGLLAQDVTLEGGFSFDLDNVLKSGTLTPGLGIKNYAWEVLEGPQGCTAPASASGASPSFTLFKAGEALAPACQGAWRVGLEVTDDDEPAPRKAGDETLVFIGNCPGDLCVDFPTEQNKFTVEFTKETDVIIYYHLDSLLYDKGDFGAGLFARLELFHESDPVNRVYHSDGPNIRETVKGSLLTFHWRGFKDQTYEPPKPGFYTIKVSLLDANLGSTQFETEQKDAISVSVADPVILGKSDKYVSFDELQGGGDAVNLFYDIKGGASPDQVRWRVLDASKTEVASGAQTDLKSEKITWDGKQDGATIKPGEYTVVLETYRGGELMGQSDPHKLVVYRLSLAPDAAASGSKAELFLYVNTDDDDRNNLSDLGEAAPGEDDLVQLTATVEPSIKGSLTLSSEAPGALKFWKTGAKGAEISTAQPLEMSSPTLPLFVEALAPAQSGLSLMLKTEDGVELKSPVLNVNSVEVQVVRDANDNHVVDAADAAAYFVNIALWDKAYDTEVNIDATKEHTFLNGPGLQNFVERDSGRFYLRVSNPAANLDTTKAETITLRLGTVDAAGGTDDNPNDLTLAETGPDTGEFVSTSHILTSHNIQNDSDPESDDNFKAHDGVDGEAADESPGDRTHKAGIDGSLRVQYVPAEKMPTKGWDVPVCQRAPEMRRKVQVRVHVFREPFLDVGLDGKPDTKDAGEGDGKFTYDDANGDGEHNAGEKSEPYVDISRGAMAPLPGDAAGVQDGRGPVMQEAKVREEFTRADIAWAQACIKTEVLGISFDDAPKLKGVDILLDGVISQASGGDPEDIQVINLKYGPQMTTDVVELFIGAPIAPVANKLHALSFSPLSNVLMPSVPHGETSFIVMEPNLPLKFRVLAHELGHILTNKNHSAADKMTFFPLGDTGVNENFNDGTVHTYRRLTGGTITDARKPREAGNFTDVGNNNLLKLP